jgi:hypothetical protein
VKSFAKLTNPMLSAAGILPEDIISRHILAVLHLKDLIAIENAACAHHWVLPVRSWISRVRLPKFTVSNRTINTSAQWLSSRNANVDALTLSVEGDLSSLQLCILSSLCKGAKTISLGSATQLSHIEPILLCGETADKVCSVVVSRNSAGLTSAALYGIVRYARQLHELTVPMYIFDTEPEDASGTNMQSHCGGDQTGFLPQLRRLHALQYGFQSNTIALRRIVTVARTVTELRLESCSSRDGSFTDEHIDLIATHCPDLRTLYVQNCYDVTDVGLQALVQKCHALHTWKVERPQCITNSTLFSVAIHCAARLQELHLQQWPAITDNGVIPVLQACRLLHTITVWSCAQLTDATLDALLQYHANDVTHLTVAGCPLLTGEAVVRVGLSCRKLRDFRVGKSYLTEAQLSSLQRLRTREVLKVLPFHHSLSNW